jgi:hypothetical protein
VVGTLKPRDLPEFKWVNTVLGNLKSMLAGSYHALKCRKYAQTSLAAFASPRVRIVVAPIEPAVR